MSLSRIPLAAVLCTAGLLCAQSAPTLAADAPGAVQGGAPRSLSFAGATYVHRRSHDGQNEFTPPSQRDPAAAPDRLTLIDFGKVTTSGQLSEVAAHTAAIYARSGKVIRTAGSPESPGHPAQHLVVAVLGAPDFVEVSFARFVMTPDGAESVVYAHRVYGDSAPARDEKLGQWLRANGTATERSLMTWAVLPSLPALRRLPPTGL
jgi:hypothetical protein